MSILVFLRVTNAAKLYVLLYKHAINIRLLQCFFQQDDTVHTFTGHSASVMSVDFHPNKDDLICSCDGNGEIRLWSISNGRAVRNFKVTKLCVLSILSISSSFALSIQFCCKSSEVPPAQAADGFK